MSGYKGADLSMSILEGKNERRRKKRTRQRQLQDYVFKVFDAYLQGYLKSKSASDPSDPLLDPKHPLFQARLEEVRSRVVPEIIENFYRGVEESVSHSQRSDKSSEGEKILMEVSRQYFPLPGRYPKGGNPHRDLAGSFFLLAVTEHLGKKPGCYGLVARLLRIIRGSGKATTRESSLNELTRKRIRKFKRSHPNWKTHVDSMTRVLG